MTLPLTPLSGRIYTLAGPAAAAARGATGGDTVNEQRSRPELWVLGWSLNGCRWLLNLLGARPNLGCQGLREVDEVGLQAE